MNGRLSHLRLSNKKKRELGPKGEVRFGRSKKIYLRKTDPGRRAKHPGRGIRGGTCGPPAR